jgi:hypothetical protein
VQNLEKRQERRYLEDVVEKVLAGLDVLRLAEDEGQKVDYEHVQLLVQVIDLRQETVRIVFLQQHFPVGVYAHLGLA